MDENPIDYYTNNILRGRWTTSGNLILGSAVDEGQKFQVRGTNGAGVFINPNLSRERDRIMIGGYNNLGDGQSLIFRTSNDYGASYNNILTERDGNIGLGINGPYTWNGGKPTIQCLADGQLSFMPYKLNFGNIVGPVNSSALEINVPVDEWKLDSLYPNGFNSYYIGTRLSGSKNGGKKSTT